MQDESKCLNKIHCRKVVEVEKFTQTIHELKESALVHGATTNAIRDYQRWISELNVRLRGHRLILFNDVQLTVHIRRG